MRQREMRRVLGDRAVVWIDPARLAWHSGSKWPVTKQRLARAGRFLPKAVLDPLRPVLKAREPFLIPRDCFARPTPIEADDRYTLLCDFIAKRKTPEETRWYRDLTDMLARTGVARHKQISLRNREEILEFLNSYAGGLIDSLQCEGFKPDETGYESSAVITANGELTKAGSGNHRFAICRILGVSPFPLRIVAAHEDWYRSQAGDETPNTERLLSLFPKVEAAHR